MLEITKVTLENEMDLVIAHRRTMKLAEHAGLSISAQTTFATAVSEVARTSIDSGKNGCLVLGISKDLKKERYLIASIKNERQNSIKKSPGIAYAKRLVNKFNILETDNDTTVQLYLLLPANITIENNKIEHWKALFSEEGALSPYEEIKRKNNQLKELAEKLQESENQYKTLTNTLPIMIFKLDTNGSLKFTNEWMSHYLGTHSITDLQERWQEYIHTEDRASFSIISNQKITHSTSTIRTQCRLLHAATGEYVWHLISVTPNKNVQNHIIEWTGYAVDIQAQKEYEATLQDNEELREIRHQLEENKLALEENITELNRSNEELQQFAFVASHDLQEPVRKVAYYADMLLNKYGESLDKKGKGYLDSLFLASVRMRNLINDVLSYSQVNTKTARFEQVDLNLILQQVLNDHEVRIREKQAKVQVPQLPFIYADRSMMSQLFSNLIGNALKYSKPDVAPEIVITSVNTNTDIQISIQDNGVGFDNKYADGMFKLFQRLHSKDEYAGTGVGLALCRRIVDLHHGNITAMGKPDAGSTFIITLPLSQN